MLRRSLIPPFLALLAVPLLLGGCAAAQTSVPAPLPAAPPAARPVYDRGMVSAADPRAAEAGADMLRQGGSATDAAIATMLALSVVEPQSSGIGGGGFFVRGTPTGEVETIDGRETAPMAATPDWFLDAQGNPLPFRQAVVSGLSVGVPGNLALAAEAHRRFGKLPWAELFRPAIRLARDGWAVTARLHTALDRSRDSAMHDPLARALFFDASGAPVPVGTLVRNPAMAETLEEIAAKGADAFYRGKLATALAAKVRGETPHPQGMTAQDIAAYRAKSRPAVCGSYRAYRICGMGPPSSGTTTVLAILGQLRHFDLAALGPGSPVAWHLFAESQRLAYADRESYLADSDFVAVPVSGLIDPTYLATRGALIRTDSTLAEVQAGTPHEVTATPPDGDEPEEHGTSHFVAIDSAGNAVSYTSTIESAFGSGIVVGGFFLNNELTDFSLAPEKDGQPVANRIEGGKRPRSSMAPMLVYAPDGKLLLAVGAAGGATIPVQVVKALIGVIDFRLPISDALALPVLFSPGDTVMVEPGTALEAMIPRLRALGHKQIVIREMPLKANAIAVMDGRLSGAADPRSEGRAISQ